MLAAVRPIERTCYAVGTVLILSGVVHLAILVGTGATWAGPLSWRKPTTFGLSFGLTLITIAWVTSYLPLSDRSRRWTLGAFAAACIAEVALITMQAWRHVPSHFNMTTPFDTAIARILAAGGAVLIVVIAYLTAASWRKATAVPPVPPSMRLALRAGFLALDVALAIGAVMIAIGVVDVTNGDQQAAYGVGAQWKPAHAVPMHGILVLPLLAWLLARVPWPESRRVRVVTLAVAGYALLCLVAVLESIAGLNPMHAFLADLPGAIGAAAIAGAGVITLVALFRRPSAGALPLSAAESMPGGVTHPG
jgi:hypothetical protein